MKLPIASQQYSAGSEAQFRAQLEREDNFNRKTYNDVEIGAQRLILTSPNGTRWNVTVSNAGAWVLTAL